MDPDDFWPNSTAEKNEERYAAEWPPIYDPTEFEYDFEEISYLVGTSAM